MNVCSVLAVATVIMVAPVSVRASTQTADDRWTGVLTASFGLSRAVGHDRAGTRLDGSGAFVGSVGFGALYAWRDVVWLGAHLQYGVHESPRPLATVDGAFPEMNQGYLSLPVQVILRSPRAFGNTTERLRPYVSMGPAIAVLVSCKPQRGVTEACEDPSLGGPHSVDWGVHGGIGFEVERHMTRLTAGFTLERWFVPVSSQGPQPEAVRWTNSGVRFVIGVVVPAGNRRPAA